MRLRTKYRAAIKRLSAVETQRTRSNQHELNGNAALRALLGDSKREWDETNWLILAEIGRAHV